MNSRQHSEQVELSNLQVEITSNEYAEWREIYKTSDHQKINGFSRHAHDTVIEPVVFSFKDLQIQFLRGTISFAVFS